jgi:hypothetical protein
VRGAGLLRDGGQVGPQRRNAVFADQALDLNRQGSECDGVNDRERAQKNPLRGGEVRGLDTRSEADPGDPLKQIAARGDEFVNPFREPGEYP